MNTHSLQHLKELESESIYILREVVAQFERPAILFSGGKDSIVVSHLAKRAFYPARIPFPLVHIDTGHNFPETILFRDDFVNKMDVDLSVGSVQESIDSGRVTEEVGRNASRNVLQTVTLLDMIRENKFDCMVGGARRDEEKARAKERIFSHRDEFGQWDPKKQRPELWNIFNGRKNLGEHFRVFPISNWTELDVWNYIEQEKIEVPSIYFAHERDVFVRDGVLMAVTDFIKQLADEPVTRKKIRFRTVGDATCTGAIESLADTVARVIEEVAGLRTTERGTRADDKRSETAMEDRKRTGYF
ncbi:MAG: sulfate adenylyltransferase subunit CysD [bacterium]|nr:sulfate adenylyltransferase subunit CysD [bacterium]